MNGKPQLPKIPFGIVAYVSAGPFAKQLCIMKLELLPYSVTNRIAIFAGYMENEECGVWSAEYGKMRSVENAFFRIRLPYTQFIYPKRTKYRPTKCQTTSANKNLKKPLARARLIHPERTRTRGNAATASQDSRTVSRKRNLPRGSSNQITAKAHRQRNLPRIPTAKSTTQGSKSKVKATKSSANVNRT